MVCIIEFNDTGGIDGFAIGIDIPDLALQLRKALLLSEGVHKQKLKSCIKELDNGPFKGIYGKFKLRSGYTLLSYENGYIPNVRNLLQPISNLVSMIEDLGLADDINKLDVKEIVLKEIDLCKTHIEILKRG